MSETRTYTIIERDRYGTEVNTIPGLTRDVANQLAAALRTGSAYHADPNRECEVIAELTLAEQAQEAARTWRENASNGERGNHLDKTSHIAQVLRDVAADLDKLGELAIPGSAMLSLKIQVFGGLRIGAREQIALVDTIAAALGQTASRETLSDGTASHYGTGHGDLMVVTTARESEDAETVAAVEAVPA